MKALPTLNTDPVSRDMEMNKLLREVKAKYRDQLLKIPGVEGIGIGDGCIRLYIHDNSVLERVPSELDGITVDHIVTGGIVAL